ncbi:Hypothetical predicted protein, partial [Olea europaea subsp. europaea]
KKRGSGSSPDGYAGLGSSRPSYDQCNDSCSGSSIIMLGRQLYTTGCTAAGLGVLQLHGIGSSSNLQAVVVVVEVATVVVNLSSSFSMFTVIGPTRNTVATSPWWWWCSTFFLLSIATVSKNVRFGENNTATAHDLVVVVVLSWPS